MINKIVNLWDKHPEATLTSYCYSNSEELYLSPRRAVIVIPGGGYGMTSDREAEPIALRFVGDGFNAFVLRYTVTDISNDLRWNPLIEAALAVKYVREHAEEYNTDPAHIFVCGFSAGGHLAASCGTMWNIPEVRKAIGVESGEAPEGINRPDGMVLCYPVITAGEHGHEGSFINLSQHNPLLPEDIEKYSIETNVNETTAPAFIWHTFNDNCVQVENSIIMQMALAKHHVPFEAHIFPDGEHGTALCNEITASGRQGNISEHNEVWTALCSRWMKDL